ncbi:MAG: response regulator [Pseudomonadota bacterium]
MRHKLLVRQLRRALGVSSERDLQARLDALRARGDGALADGFDALLAAAGSSYARYDRDLQVRTRMLEISSDELTGANAQLRAEAQRQREVLLSLQASVQRLTFEADGAAPGHALAAAAGFDDDLLGLTHALERLVQQRETARELTEQILDQLPIPVFLKDRAGRFVRFNRHFEEFSQRSRAQMLGRCIEEFATPEWAAQSIEEDARAWDSGHMVTSERRLANIDPPIDFLVNRVVISSGGESYLLGFSIDISEQRAAREAMQRAVESAQAASLAKSEFLANMSHEIRTPMNGILGMTELVLESPLAPEQREDLALVKASADALLTIVNQILDFSKIEAGKLDIEEVPFDLHKLVHETVRSMALRAQQKGLALLVELPPGLPRVMKGDPGRLRQVLLNLLGNAIKFTQQGKVVLALQAGPESGDRREVAFAVSDTGIGIPEDKQKLVFEAFSQVDGSTTREYGGTGLGLTICRRLVILMRGQMQVASEPGVGSVFSFTVPLRQTGVQLQAPLPLSWLAGRRVLLADDDERRASALAAVLAEAGMLVLSCASCDAVRGALASERFELVLLAGELGGVAALVQARLASWPPLLLVSGAGLSDPCAAQVDAVQARPVSAAALLDGVLGLLGAQAGQMLAAASVAAPAVPREAGIGNSGLQILLAEDNPVNQRLALRLLEKMGHRITLVDNGIEALEQGVRGSYDLILMDVQMPGLDGLSATRHIRQWEAAHGGHVPIIAMTARAMQGDRERCLEAGMDDYLSKPIDSARLRQLVGQFDEAQPGPVLDWRAALARLDGDAGLLLELAVIFLDDGPVLLQALNRALVQDDLDALQRAVHSLNGVLVNFGALRAVALAGRLSEALHDGSQRGQWPLLAAGLGRELDDVYAALRALVAGGATAMA